MILNTKVLIMNIPTLVSLKTQNTKICINFSSPGLLDRFYVVDPRIYLY